MKQPPPSLAQLRNKYDRLKKSLARIGYISQGSVLRRDPLRSGRSGCQWSRKVAQKTITVSLSESQFRAMKEAVANERKLRHTVRQMEQVSRQIIFATTPDTRRRKPLGRKVLGLI